MSAADDERTRAVRGRLLLWGAAVSEAHRLLLHAERQAARIEQFQSRNATSDPIDAASLRDLSEAMSNARMLAIVLFCQVLLSGNGDPGKAARADDVFRAEWWPKIKAAAFGSLHTQFDELTIQLRHARHKMIGHADAAAFEISHENNLSLWMFQRALHGIDFKYWESTMTPLKRAIAHLRP